MEKYEEILKKIKKEELEKFILENIMQSRYIREIFEIEFSRVFS